MSRRKPSEGSLTIFRYIYTHGGKNTLRTASTRSKYIFQFLPKFFRKGVDMCFSMCYNINIPCPCVETLEYKANPNFAVERRAGSNPVRGSYPITSTFTWWITWVIKMMKPIDVKTNCFWRYIMLVILILISGIVLICFGIHNLKYL